MMTPIRQVSSVEASLRLDSVASAGMGMSRSKMSEAIKSGSVLVNWKEATSGVTEARTPEGFFSFFLARCKTVLFFFAE